VTGVTIEDDELYGLAEAVGLLLGRHGLLLATAESCTGGWAAHTMTDVAGSSAWFDRGFVTYSNESKKDLLAVPAEVLLEHGAVSEQTVLAMAEGALRSSRADCALAISGIAGPSGGSAEKPVGTVWIAWQKSGEKGVAKCFRFGGNRREVRRQAVRAALEGIVDLYGH
jgi:nicotinamide-nucleotide amidase